MPRPSTTAVAAAVAAAAAALMLVALRSRRQVREDGDGTGTGRRQAHSDGDGDGAGSAASKTTTHGGYESLIGNTPLLYLPHISSLLPEKRTRIFVKMESMNPGGTGKDRAALSMILAAERRGELPPPLPLRAGRRRRRPSPSPAAAPCPPDVPPSVHAAVLAAVRASRTGGIAVEGTSGSTGIALAALCGARGHGAVVVLPDDQAEAKAAHLRRLGCGVATVRCCGISHPDHYVNVARRAWEWLQEARRYDGIYAAMAGGGDGDAPVLRAAFMNQFENLANVQSHYDGTGPEIHAQLGGRVDAFVMSAGTGGTLVGVGGYLKERWHRDRDRDRDGAPGAPPRIVLVDPPGSSLFHRVKHGVAYAPQQAERRLRRHRYDTLAEGIGLDRITANFGLGCESIDWGGGGRDVGGERRPAAAFGDRLAALRHEAAAGCVTPSSETGSPVIDDARRVTDQQAVHMAHYLLRHEGLFVGASTAMNVAGALAVAERLPPGSNVVTVVCDVGSRHAGRFWNRAFLTEERGLAWPGDDGDMTAEELLNMLGFNIR